MAVPGQERVLWLQACASTHWLRLSALVTRTSGMLTTPIVHSFIPSQTIEDYVQGAAVPTPGLLATGPFFPGSVRPVNETIGLGPRLTWLAQSKPVPRVARSRSTQGLLLHFTT